MRTNININDRLLREAMKRTGLKTKRATVDAALESLVNLEKQADIVNSFGKHKSWEGNLREMRRSRW